MNIEWKKILGKILPHLGSVVFFILLSCIYFAPQFQGKSISKSDISSYKGMSKEAREYHNETGEYPLWTNSMFGGMPTFQIGLPNKTNYLDKVQEIIRISFNRPIGYFLAMAICSYILLIAVGCNILLSILGAIGFTFTSYHFIIYEAGHMNKFKALGYTPLILAGIVLVLRNKIWIGGVLFALGLGLDITVNHIQITYYFGLAILPYVIMKYLKLSIHGKWFKISKYSTVLLLGLILAVGSNAMKLWTSQEYMSSTMRGDPILEKEEAGQASSSATEGLAWDYAMNWSHGYVDLLTFLVPGAAGGASSEPVDESYAVNDSRVWSGYIQRSGNKAPLYHGNLPFTSGPVYFGAIFVFLLVLSMFVLNGPLKWGTLIAIIFTILLSLGSNLEWFNRLLFDYLPKFNIFRSPNSASAITPLFVVFGGMLGLKKMLDGPRRFDYWKKPLFWSLGLTGGLCALLWLLGPSFIDFSSSSDARFTQQGADVGPLLESRAQLLRGDALRSLLIIAIAFAGLWAWLQKKINKIVLLIAFIVVGLFDLMGVGNRYLSEDDFAPKRTVNTPFTERPADKQILKDESIHYRVHDLSINTFNSSECSYFHNCVGGYHAAKLQRYQDMIDFYISKNNQKVLNMLNTKYIITQDGQVKQNPGALGNAWFVNEIIPAEDHAAEINKVGNIQPANQAVVHRDFLDQVKGLDGNVQGQINLVEYHPDKLVFRSQSDKKGLAVFSEVWYEPDKGWEATIDGEPAQIIRTNYILRGMVIPPGNHKIVMEFKPKSYAIGSSISMVSSLLVIILSIGAIIYSFYRKESVIA